MSECQRVGVCACVMCGVKLLLHSPKSSSIHLFTHSYQNLGTHRFYTTLYRIYNSSSSMAASSKPHKISVPNTGENKTYFYILSHEHLEAIVCDSATSSTPRLKKIE